MAARYAIIGEGIPLSSYCLPGRGPSSPGERDPPRPQWYRGVAGPTRDDGADHRLQRHRRLRAHHRGLRLREQEGGVSSGRWTSLPRAVGHPQDDGDRATWFHRWGHYQCLATAYTLPVRQVREGRRLPGDGTHPGYRVGSLARA